MEAALVVSFFFLTLICLVYLFERMTLRTTLRTALYAVGRELAEDIGEQPLLLANQIEKELVENIGEGRLDDSLIVGGSAGLDCSRSKKLWSTTIMELSVCYQIEIPVLLFRIPLIEEEEHIRIKGWTGYDGQGGTVDASKTVYVTEHGMVYHEKRDCTYLDLSVRAVSQNSVSDLRNASGGIYKRCTSCGGYGEQGLVYITTYGERYHSSLSCSKLKRRVYEVSLEDVLGLGGCSKCVK